MERARWVGLLWALGVLMGGGVMGCRTMAATTEMTRFFYSGDGTLDLVSEKTGKRFSGRYRQGRAAYVDESLAAICDIFDAPFDARRPKLSLRLIEFLDFLQDRMLPGARITITSGYRSPVYNQALRQKGALAAKASLHQYGMAADFFMEGVAAERIWETVKALGFGGAGYYHGKTVHVDVGPARFWDETTSGVGSGISDNNKLIQLVTDYDIYRPGDPVWLHFTRMTAFPIGVAPEFALERNGASSQDGPAATFVPTFTAAPADKCPRFSTIDQMAFVGWRLPPDLPPGRYRIRARFCGSTWEGMPGQVATPIFEITS